jgi:hypothetical protein
MLDINDEPPQYPVVAASGQPLTMRLALEMLIERHGIAEVIDRLADITDHRDYSPVAIKLEEAVEAALKLTQALKMYPIGDIYHILHKH